MKKFSDPKKPELYRKMFPGNAVPRIVLGGPTYTLDTPQETWITDTTFRDGQQSLPPFQVDHIVQLFDMIHELDNESGLIRQTEFFVYTRKDREAVLRCINRGYRFPEVIGWIRATESDFGLVKGLGLSEIGILTSISDYQIFLKLGMTRKQAMEHYLRIVKMTLDEGIIPFCNLEDTTRADIHGFVVPFAIELMKLSKQYGLPVKVRACDTLGFGVDTPGAVLPRSVPGIVHALRHDAGVPAELLEWHGHNDFHKGLSNATSAWLYGCSAVNGTWLGVGERTGNTPIEALIMEHLALWGNPGDIDTTSITRIARFMEAEMGIEIPGKQPFVGQNFNLTKAGIHADGLLKHPQIYNIFDTVAVLDRVPMVGITDKSGVSGIAYWINNHFGLTGPEKLSKNDPRVKAMKSLIDDLYEGGRITAISPEELMDMCLELMADIVEKHSK